jgi:hypothetical protein
LKFVAFTLDGFLDIFLGGPDAAQDFQMRVRMHGFRRGGGPE